MRLVPTLIGVAVAGAAGYFLEPMLRPTLLSFNAVDQPEAVELAENDGGGESAEPEVAPPTPAPAPAPEPAPAPVPAAPAWIADVKPSQLPEKVTLKTKVELPLPGSDAPMILPAGAPVTPVRIEGQDLVISPFAGPIEGKVPVMQTDLLARFGNKPPAPEPEPVAAVTPMPEPTPAPAPTPTPAPEPAAAAGLDAEGIVAVMQDSIKGGQIKEFTFDQVLGWKAGEEEEHDGAKYQTGTVAYKAETIFGVKNIQAQALIKDGKVTKWIWPKSGMEIK